MRNTNKTKEQKMNRVDRYDYITQEAKSDDEIMTSLEWVRFHYFNPNGLYQQAKELHDSAYEYVKAGKANYGVMLGYFNYDFHYNQMTKLADMRKPRYNKVSVFVEMFEDKVQSMKDQLVVLEKESI